jgi:hypothetical protein
MVSEWVASMRRPASRRSTHPFIASTDNPTRPQDHQSEHAVRATSRRFKSCPVSDAFGHLRGIRRSG